MTTMIPNTPAISADLPVAQWTPGQVTAFYVRLVQAKAEGHYLAHAYWPGLALCRSFEEERRRIGRMCEQIAVSGDAKLLAFWHELVTGECDEKGTIETDAPFECITCCECREPGYVDGSPEQRCDCRCHWM